MAQKFALTEKQRNMLDFIKQYAASNGGMAPSFEEMAAHAGLASKSGVHRIIEALVSRGHIARLRATARSVVVIE